MTEAGLQKAESLLDGSSQVNPAFYFLMIRYYTGPDRQKLSVR